MKTLPLVLLLCLCSTAMVAQRGQTSRRKPPEILPSVSSLQQGEGRVPSPKKPGHYTVKDWQRLIDSLWGQGLTTAQKLSVFDTYWNLVDQTWGGFPNLVVNWDSLKSVYRPLVAAGVSRGRFYGILCRLTRALCEWHVYTIDRGIDGSMGSDFISILEYPNYQSFHYQPGIPLIDIDQLLFRTDFGAGLTFLPDSTALVYSVMANHPLSLQPGDVILGYDGIPWKQTIRELLDAELPMLGGGSLLGATSAAAEHSAIMSVGNNWGLFDTIDVVKYSTNDTLHYPTSLLGTINPPYFVATEQMAVKGVPFPDIQNNKLVSWGVIQGTSIGYVYAWDWRGVPVGQTRALFAQAIDQLIHQQKVQGLILDYRTNWGGNEDYANDGYRQLFNFDPTQNYSYANRVRGGAHLSFTLGPVWDEEPFAPGSALFDRPIAVLTGPLGGSAGDYNAFRMRFHPMVRFFGKPTAGAYTAFSSQAWYGTLTDPYFCRVDDASLYSKFNNEGFMIHKPFPVDEEVWLTRDGVAKGEDDVVKRALAWINTLSYAHDTQLSHPTKDTLHVTARVENPLAHTLKVTVTLKDSLGAVIDSLLLKDDGLHSDGAAGDGLWGCTYVPAEDGTIHATIRTDDLTAGTSRTLADASQIIFTHGALIALDANTISYGAISNTLQHRDTTFTVRNIGFAADSITILLDPVTVDPATAVAVSPTVFFLAAQDSQKVTFSIQPKLLVPQYFCGCMITVQPKTGMAQTSLIKYFTFQIVITGAVTTATEIPKVFVLEQNFPNPFNPSTMIRYGLPNRSHVTLSVFNTLGQQVALLQNGEQEAGYHEVKFDGSGLSSGVYFYRIEAGSFVETRKLVLLR